MTFARGAGRFYVAGRGNKKEVKGSFQPSPWTTAPQWVMQVSTSLSTKRTGSISWGGYNISYYRISSSRGGYIWCSQRETANGIPGWSLSTPGDLASTKGHTARAQSVKPLAFLISSPHWRISTLPMGNLSSYDMCERVQKSLPSMQFLEMIISQLSVCQEAAKSSRS